MDPNQHSENGPPQTGDATSGAADQGSQPQYVTMEQLTATIQGALGDFSKSIVGDVRKTVAGMIKTAPQATQPAKESAAPQMTDIDARMEAALRREREIMGAIHKHGFDEPQAELARKLVEIEKPESPMEYLAGLAKSFGRGAAQGNGSGAQPAQKAAPNPNPVSDGGAPGMTGTLESDDTPIHKWSEDKVRDYIAKNGYQKFGEMVRGRLKRDLANTRFSLPRSG